MSIEIYGVAYLSPCILWNLAPTKKYFPILLVNDLSAAQVKEDVKLQTKQHGGSHKTPIIFASGIHTLQTFLRQFPDLNCKIWLFEYPSVLLPFFHPKIQWLDCDHQSGGAWQVAKLKPEDMEELIDKQSPVSKAGREFLLSVKRYSPDNRLSEIEKFTQNVPKFYKDLLANLDQETKSPLKVAKDGRKSKECLRSLLQTSLDLVPAKDTRSSLVELVLGYAAEQIGKRDYLTKLSVLTSDEFTKKEFLSLRKWLDSKNGDLLRSAFFDYLANKERRSWTTILSSYKKVAEDDLTMLLSHFKASVLVPEDKTAEVDALQSDKIPPKRPNHPVLVSVPELFNI